MIDECMFIEKSVCVFVCCGLCCVLPFAITFSEPRVKTRGYTNQFPGDVDCKIINKQKKNFY